MSLNPQYIDADAYQGGGNDELTIQLIVMQHIQRITRLASTEFHGGFWYDIGVQPNGGAAPKRYMPAANEAYSNAIDCLADLLSPFYDEEMRAAEEQSTQEQKELFDELKAAKREAGDPLKKDKWYDRKVYIKRRLFRELVQFVKRNGLLEGASYEEEVVS